MKVGVLQFFSWPGRRGDLKDVYFVLRNITK